TDVQKLQERFGKNGMWMWKVANGIDDEPVQPRGDHVSISTETTLESFTRDKAQIQRLLLSLVDEIHQRAIEYGYSFRTVGVKLVRTDFSIETRETTFNDAKNDNDTMSSTVLALVEKFSLSNKEPAIRKLGIKLSHLSRTEVVASEKQGAGAYHKVQKTLLDYM